MNTTGHGEQAAGSGCDGKDKNFAVGQFFVSLFYESEVLDSYKILLDLFFLGLCFFFFYSSALKHKASDRACISGTTQGQLSQEWKVRLRPRLKPIVMKRQKSLELLHSHI